MDVSEDHVWAICKKPIESLPKATLGEKGSSSINRASKERNDTLHCASGDQVHQECHCKYCARNQIAKVLKQNVQPSVATSSSTRVLRSAKQEFSFCTDCFYYGTPALLGRKRKASDVPPVRTLDTRGTILAVCQKRGDE